MLTKAKAVICYYAVRQLGYSGIAVGKFLSLNPGAVSHASRCGEQILLIEKVLLDKLENNL